LIANTGIAQEDVTVNFDPRETGEFTWQDGLLLLAACLAWYGAWRWLTRFIEKRRERIPWKRLRYTLPTAVLAVDALMVLAVQIPVQSSWLKSIVEGAAMAVGVANLPIFPLVAVFSPWLGDWPVWLRAFVGAFCVWTGWHCVVRLLERRAWRDIPVSLDLSRER